MSKLEAVERGTKADLLLVDACVLINLYSTQVAREILAAQPERVGVVDVVLSESLFVASRVDGPPTLIDIRPEEAAGVLTRLEMSEPEIETYVRHAVALDDGEAATVSVAASRLARMVTDDRAAIGYVRRTVPGVEVLRTSDLIRQWSNATGAPSSELGAVLSDIRDLGRFIPGQGDALAHWWAAALEDAR